jgi:hypothetical protein
MTKNYPYKGYEIAAIENRHNWTIRISKPTGGHNVKVIKHRINTTNLDAREFVNAVNQAMIWITAQSDQ